VHGNHSVYPAGNGLSDHDAQILIPGNLQSLSQHIIHKSKLRIINIETITNFQSLLQEQTWNAVYAAYNDNSKFNLFLNTFLTIYEHNFQTVYKRYDNTNNNRCVTKGIRISCKCKRSIYVLSRRIDNHILTDYCKKYCEILWKVIKRG
jgi:hypothetical protein